MCRGKSYIHKRILISFLLFNTLIINEYLSRSYTYNQLVSMKLIDEKEEKLQPIYV
jgi:hypothetical protein